MQITKQTITIAVSNPTRGNLYNNNTDRYPESNHENITAPKEVEIIDNVPTDYLPQYSSKPANTGSRGNNKSKSVKIT
jgi:hypothetical protein